ncbi:flagellar filament capping protein FliD [Cupriavidus nantongensis]|uniref:Flagellar hook-associated protein 2 n=1 Tax=Cupriavidus nantongensis TaxID=1796606 RepID=A0A142JV41_9BURK|nr:flagellar filament capping protein FliD [Cupriavidus nantongensis]AMR81953.1 flagellar hook protein [Cupriavidus nantongensis]
MPTISNLGVGSGLDLGALLDQLTTAEQVPLTVLKQKQSSYNTKLSAYGQLQSMLAAFQGAANQLSKPSFFNAATATSSNTGVLTATGSNTAAAGTYAINVSALAQAQSLVGTGQAKQDTAIGTGTIHIDFGAITGGTLDSNPASPTYGKYSGAAFTANSGSTGFDITIDSSNNTLQGIRDAINKANAGVTASIINDGSGTPYRLVLNSNNTGATNSMRISVTSGDGTSALSDLVAHDPAGAQNLQQTVAAQNATLTVNNIAIQSASNQVSGAVQGVTLSLAQTGTSNVTVQRDNAAVQNGVQAFVTAYNNLQKAAANLSAYDPTTKTGSPLTGDGVLRVIQNQIRGVLNTPQPGSGSNAITALAQVGVTFQVDGTMALDTAKLTKAMADNPSGVAALFGNDDGKSGYGNQLSTTITALTSSKGALTAATDGINRSLKDLSDQYSATELRINATIENYRAQFTQLDMVMAKMKNTSSYLTQQFNALNNSSGSK